jgi:hypothetical protein
LSAQCEQLKVKLAHSEKLLFSAQTETTSIKAQHQDVDKQFVPLIWHSFADVFRLTQANEKIASLQAVIVSLQQVKPIAPIVDNAALKKKDAEIFALSSHVAELNKEQVSALF